MGFGFEGNYLGLELGLHTGPYRIEVALVKLYVEFLFLLFFNVLLVQTFIFLTGFVAALTILIFVPIRRLSSRPFVHVN